MYDLEKIITKDSILSKVSQQDIFRKYLGINPIIGVGFRNPIRDDVHPDCRFYIDSRGMLKFKDFAMGWNWDCFNIVQYKYGVNFGEALKIIAEDFNLSGLKVDRQLVNGVKNLQNYIPKKLDIQVRFRDWKKYDLNYWGQYHLDRRVLQLFNVYPIVNAWMDSSLVYTQKGDDVAYCYYFGNNNYKLYFPFRSKDGERGRFYHSDASIIQGINQLDLTGNDLVITKSLKDVMCLSLFDIPSIAPMSESVLLSRKNFTKLQQRFKRIFTLFDNDRSGRRLSIKMRNTYGTIPLLFSSEYEKDFSDNLKKYGKDVIVGLIERIKTKYHE